VPGAEQLLEDERLAAREFWQTVEHPRAGVLRYPGPPFAMSETQARAGRAPLRAEHNAEILTGEAGYELADLTILSDRGVT
jgi:crotonobetainyl-CoA:carnitine CoA-transferase CaiB-like acyl-CoA transferase